MAETGLSQAELKRSQETKTRVMTGVIGGFILVALFFLGGHVGVSFGAAIIAGMISWELSNAFYSMNDRKEKVKALVGTSWLIICVNMFFPKTMLECLVIAFMGMFAYYLSTAERHEGVDNLRRHFDEFVFTVFVLVYAVVFCAFFPLIRDGLNGVRWLSLFLLIVWAGDTGAYFVGRKYGATKLYPLISPGKTVEGALGGLGCSTLIALIFKLLFFSNLGWFGALVTGSSVGVVSQIGDLCESFFKRAYRIKDSSKILPGHGGILDRFDGVIFSLPVMYFCLKIFS